MYEMKRTGATIKYLRTSMGKSQEYVAADMNLMKDSAKVIKNALNV